MISVITYNINMWHYALIQRINPYPTTMQLGVTFQHQK